MLIYTSYFSKEKILKENNIIPIGIAIWPPNWFLDKSISDVAPPPHLVRGIKDGTYTPEQYAKIYEDEVLKKLDIKKFINKLEKMSQGKDIALCCYERPSDFCHRHLLANYINNNSEYKIEEFKETQQNNYPTLFDETGYTKDSTN